MTVGFIVFCKAFRQQGNLVKQPRMTGFLAVSKTHIKLFDVSFCTTHIKKFWQNYSKAMHHKIRISNFPLHEVTILHTNWGRSNQSITIEPSHTLLV
ncbi:hypothetical protein EB796_012423 [Bugula neritina]|uniref:Uncharacterized protein n=1 Tax=Bugula neritina TaxID=10212 RepID=A0A7J7JTG1_BUGNE|nr:hypothetical protein EB796_012423 [Bugula neritina]